MKKLTEKHFWERNYQSLPVGTIPTATPDASTGRSVTQWIKRTFGSSLRDHSNYLLWDVLMAQSLPKAEQLKVLEVGSAPGEHLLLFHQKFGYSPYGIEYTEAGAEANRRLFAQHDIDVAQVICADVFSPMVAERYAGYFDVVSSFGFVEHFTDVRPVIQCHLELLKEGGWLVVQIPRLSGFNYWLAWLFNRETLPMHNLHIMEREAFRALFEGLPVQSYVCDYVGAIKLQLCLPPINTGWRGALFNAMKNLQMFFNVILHKIFPRAGGSTAWLSPYLVFIGKKIGTPAS